MKKIVMIALLMVGYMIYGFGAWAENYLRAGLKWEMVDLDYGKPLGDGDPEIIYHELREAIADDGTPVLREYYNAGPDYPEFGEKIGLDIVVEGEKVYLYDDKAPEKKALLYDFSLQTDDVIWVAIPSKYSPNNGYRFEKLICIGESASEDETGIEKLQLVENGYEIYLGEPFFEPIEWIKGLGNIAGILTTSTLHYAGTLIRLMSKVTLDGDVLYNAPWWTSEVKGFKVEVSPAKYFDLQGRELQTAPEKGMFIQVSNGKAVKIVR